MTACFIQKTVKIWQGYELNWMEFKESNAVGRAKWERLKS